MRVFLSAMFLTVPVALLPVASTSALADSAIQEMQSTEGPPAAPASEPAPTATPTNGDRGTSERAEQATHRHRVAGTHYERERLRQSQVHG